MASLVYYDIVRIVWSFATLLQATRLSKRIDVVVELVKKIYDVVGVLLL
jgi:hypothetical protein